MENSVNNQAEALIVYTAVCDGAPQTALMADANLIFASPRRDKSLRNGEWCG